MNDKLKQEFKNKLEQEKEVVIEKLSNVSKPDKGEHVAGDFSPTMPNYGDDTGDDPESSPNEVEDYEVNIDLTNNLQTKLDEIEEALGRIDNNEYGICEVCGKEIAEERLKINPSALTCVKCAE